MMPITPFSCTNTFIKEKNYVGLPKCKHDFNSLNAKLFNSVQLLVISLAQEIIAMSSNISKTTY